MLVICTRFNAMADLRVQANSGAAGIVIMAGVGAALRALGQKESSQGGAGFGVVSTMIVHNTAMLTALGLEPGGSRLLPLVVDIAVDSTAPAPTLVLDASGRMQEGGAGINPWMRSLAWAGQWEQFRAELATNLTKPALVVPVFDKVVGAPHTVSVVMPSAATLAPFGALELDAALSCTGGMDGQCDHWDHIITLDVTCTPPHDHPIVNDGGGGGLGEDGGARNELGRWVTPYRRRIGRWLTPITQFAPMLPAGSNCTFTLDMPSWIAVPWVSSISLRFVRGATGAAGAAERGGDASDTTTAAGSTIGAATMPVAIMSVATNGPSGAIFNQSYNPTHAAAAAVIKLPLSCTAKAATGSAQIQKAELFATISGHGSDNVFNCCEFLPTNHTFTINGKHTHSVAFMEPLDTLGCADHGKVLAGVEPNEYGAWWFGRDGWCDGQDVRPWAVDVSAALDWAPGATNTVLYSAQMWNSTNGAWGEPASNGGYFLMVANLACF